MQIVSYGENRFWHYMQIVSYGENRFWHYMQIVSRRQFACNVKTCFLGKNKKNMSLPLEKELQNFSNNASGSTN